MGLVYVVPFLPETKLRKLGAEFESVGDWQAHAVADGRLVTGQNPASSSAAAKKVLELLSPPAAPPSDGRHRSGLRIRPRA
ncbi:hypothetical protein PVT71_24815 (plasmid) [Salipiger sp. H15]|uniref:DJ-1/PfpI domain-containing protein n=1 Tax=Alloyangia sp. H15 TaxID=3029062 RepID=A0AAU8ASD4_9RHOB